MTTYQSVSGVRFGLHLATAALFYAAARYKKVDGLTNAASRIGIAAVLQGVSQKVHARLGERTKMSWLVDGISLGLVAYGMSYTDLAKRTKWLAGAAIFGSQLVISNLKPNTALARIAKIESEEECAEVYEELTNLFKENEATITPEQGIKTCKAFIQKARPFSRESWEDSPTRQISNVYSGFLDGLEGWGKVKAQMEYIEVMNTARIFDPRFLDKAFFSEQLIRQLEAREKAQLDLWMEKTGDPIFFRWSTWSMNKEKHQEVFKSIIDYISGVDDKIIFAQKVDLCEQFYINSIADYAAEDFIGSLPQKMLNFRGELVHTLFGVEKAKACMALAEFFFENHIEIPEKLDSVILYFRENLDESGKATVAAWMKKTGKFIQLCRLIHSMGSHEDRDVFEAITEYIDGIGDSITFAQKIDLCKQFYIKSKRFYSDAGLTGSPPENVSKFHEKLMDTLNGIEKAKAYMAYAEFLSKNNSTYFALLDRIIPEIRETLDGRGQAAIDDWMVEKGSAIQNRWRQRQHNTNP